MLTQEGLSIQQELKILSDAVKYGASCTSSSVGRKGTPGMLGNTVKTGLCHSFSADGRCIPLLRIPFTNQCIYDYKYRINRMFNDVVRTSFTPEEVCTLTTEFYWRNYTKESFSNPGILYNANYTMELIYQTLKLLRQIHYFYGYVHVKTIPGADVILMEKVRLSVDRMSVNLELPTAEGLKRLAPGKSRSKILTSMRQMQTRITANKNKLILHQGGSRFASAGQSTQIIVGATPENDFQMIHMVEMLYKSYNLKRVFYSALIRVDGDSGLPTLPGEPPLLRKHRLYQAS